MLVEFPHIVKARYGGLLLVASVALVSAEDAKIRCTATWLFHAVTSCRAEWPLPRWGWRWPHTASFANSTTIRWWNSAGTPRACWRESSRCRRTDSNWDQCRWRRVGYRWRMLRCG